MVGEFLVAISGGIEVAIRAWRINKTQYIWDHLITVMLQYAKQRGFFISQMDAITAHMSATQPNNIKGGYEMTEYRKKERR